ncbi:MAG TPA: zinc-dependent metalloprotease [Acidimicrobiia bacterium]|nr:zinc-dependent metalloprotease [Acidimicrobiia bacterium]
MTAASPLSGRLAARVAGSHPLSGTYVVDHLVNEIEDATARASEMVTEATRLPAPSAADVHVVGRTDWVERNLASFSHLLEPAERRIAERLEASGRMGSATAALAHQVVAAETGLLLGFLSRRVLGQYELVLPTGDRGDTVAYVGVNLIDLERRHQFRPSEFRLWVALHEMTHRAQFVGVEWMADHFLGLVERLVGQAVPEPGRLARIVRELADARAGDRPMIDERGLLGLFASPAQRETLDEVQALMSLLEGHGHVVMDRIGAGVLRGHARMSRVLKARRSDPKTQLLFRLTGLEMKMRQYELGEAFIFEVERRAGWEALDAAWTSPAALPTLDEIEDPGRWLSRVA